MGGAAVKVCGGRRGWTNGGTALEVSKGTGWVTGDPEAALRGRPGEKTGIRDAVRDSGISGSLSSLAKACGSGRDVGCGVGGPVYRVLCGARVLLLVEGRSVCTTGARRSSGCGRGRTAGDGAHGKKQRPHFDFASPELAHDCVNDSGGGRESSSGQKVTGLSLIASSWAAGPVRTRSGTPSAKLFLCCAECF